MKKKISFTSGLLIGFIVTYLWNYGYFVSKPQIVENLPVSQIDANALLAKRFSKKFPVGTTNQSLVDFLLKEGFRPHWGWKDAHSASFYQNGLCPDRWTVIWKLDDKNLIQKIEATHLNDCH